MKTALRKTLPIVHNPIKRGALWAKWLTDPKHSLAHKAGLARLIRQFADPELRKWVEYWTWEYLKLPREVQMGLPL